MGSTRQTPTLAVTILMLFAALAAFRATPASAQQFPFGTQHQAYRSGTLTPSLYTRAQQNDHVADYYDFWKNRWLKPDPSGNGWRVLRDTSGTTVSEGQGYGMVIVAAMAGHDPQAHTIFDGIVDAADYTFWRNIMSGGSAAGGGGVSIAIPEPIAGTLMVLGTAGLLAIRRRPGRATVHP